MSLPHDSSPDGPELTMLNPAIAVVCGIVAPIFESPGGATKGDLLWTAMNAWAGAETISLLMGLPGNFYGTLAQVQQQLESEAWSGRAVAVSRSGCGPSLRSGPAPSGAGPPVHA